MATTTGSDPSLLARASKAGCSVLVTISTPEAPTPIFLLGSAKQILADLTVGQLIERLVASGLQMSSQESGAQPESEAASSVAIQELLRSGACEVVLLGGSGEEERTISLDEPAAAVGEAHVDSLGSSFISLALEVRPRADTAVPESGERRELALPQVAEAEPCGLAADSAVAGQESPQADVYEGQGLAGREPLAWGEIGEETGAPEPAPQPAGWESLPEGSADTQQASDLDSAAAIVEEATPELSSAPAEREPAKGYLRKADSLRAQFLPEVQSLDFSGLFVGNLGMGIREEHARRPLLLEPSRITEVLLRGNSYRRSGDHGRALICYQELVGIDPSNADFHFLLGKTLLELGRQDEAVEALNRARELGHKGAKKELAAIRITAPKARGPLGFLRFWGQLPRSSRREGPAGCAEGCRVVDITPSQPQGDDHAAGEAIGSGARPLLGALLLRSGLISAVQLRDALGRQKATGRRLGEILIEMGAITQADLDRTLALQQDTSGSQQSG